MKEIKKVTEDKNQRQPTIKEENKSRAAESDAITYAIQLSASPTKLSLNSRIFKGIENISEIKTGIYYKYYCLESETLIKAKQNLSTIRKKIPDAFIAAFRNGEPLSMKEAMQKK